MTSYTISKSDGTTLGLVADQTINDTLSPLRLVGRGATQYGRFVAQNFVWLAENFASTAEPANKLRGMLWYDTATQTLKLWDGTIWRTAVTSGSSGGDITATTVTITGNSNFASGSFSGSLVVNGALQVNQGATFIGNLVAPTGTFTNLTVISKATIQTDPVDPTDAVNLRTLNSGLASITAGSFSGNFASITVSGTSTFSGALLRGASPVDVGTSGARFGTMFAATFDGVATSAQYADLAERYAADAPMEAGDLVMLGGSAEITKTDRDASTDVFGVVSTSPAFRMNEAAGSDATHPFVALAGRVPCKVVGPVRKGQRLVSSTLPGVARGAVDFGERSEAIFGRALADKEDDGVGLIEVVVGVR